MEKIKNQRCFSVLTVTTKKDIETLSDEEVEQIMDYNTTGDVLDLCHAEITRRREERLQYQRNCNRLDIQPRKENGPALGKI